MIPSVFFQIAARIVVTLSFLLVVSACSGEDKVILHTSAGKVAFSIDLADTPTSRAKGLMFVQNLPDDKGMLFDFAEEREVSFWMRNTFISLDMIFVASDGTIKHIHANARPHDQTGISSQYPVRFVLEIAGGRAAAIGLEVGDKMSHPLVDAN